MIRWFVKDVFLMFRYKCKRNMNFKRNKISIRESIVQFIGYESYVFILYLSF